ncbi:MAG TPA: hypothetical protein VFV67_18035 [Actinophytocola sp.]|uniref:hypothetical protein n=1 Tax=Actinophytocola sp. TaxID=1872138 RepID=UPI002DB9CBA4|nr:hypothetical protein [Actinophytocola sp.]HEU5472551.1 hypothetical protein [Actinophytocola sp.]
MDDDLPRRPRVLPGFPVLRRGPGELQVGLDPRHAAVASGLPEPVVAATAGGLTGTCTTADLMAAVGADPAGRSALGDLLAGLRGRRLLRDTGDEARVPERLVGEEITARPDRPRPDPLARARLAVAVHGDGRLAVSVACLLAAAGVGWVHVAARGTVLAQDTGTGYLPGDAGRARDLAAADAVRRADPAVRTARFGRHRRPDLVLLTDAVVPDPGLVARLFAGGVPHLPAYPRDGVGIVGPLVVPGATCCLRCADLYRAQADPCWPGIATQLAGHPQLADLACTQATAGFAAAQALDALRWSRTAHALPATWNASVEIDPASATTYHRRWQPHPECPCRDL